jgi:hypothetical protein
MTIHYHLTDNIPGYLLSSDDPPTYLSFWDGLDGLADELRTQADNLYESMPDDPEDSILYEEEGDRLHAIASKLEDTLSMRRLTSRDPSQIPLGTSTDDLWPTSMAVNGVVVHVETNPDSDHDLGWNVHLSPCVEDCPDPDCNTCGGTGRWESTTEDAPTTLVDLGQCPDCWSDGLTDDEDDQ